MSIEYNTRKTVTDGLVFYLDAGSPDSHTSGSSYWYDLSRYNLTGEFANTGSSTVNNITFNSAGGGSIEFPGGSDYINFGGVSPAVNDKHLQFEIDQHFTISAWVYIDSTSIGDPGGIVVSKSLIEDSWEGWYLAVQEIPDDEEDVARIFLSFYGQNSDDRWQIRSYPVTESIPLDTWHYITAVHRYDLEAGPNEYHYGNIYVDGEVIVHHKQFDTLDTSGVMIADTNVAVGIRADLNTYPDIQDVANSNAVFGGKIAVVQIHNKALSAAEILHNYDILKWRFV